MDQVNSFLLALSIGLFILLVLLLSARSQIRVLKCRLSRLESLAHELEIRISELKLDASELSKQPQRAKSKATKTKVESSSKSANPNTQTPASSEAAPPEPPRRAGQASQIATRTTRQDRNTKDLGTKERDWTQPELQRLQAAHARGFTVSEMATQFGADSKDIVYGIARHVYKCQGDLENLKLAPNDGKKWPAKDQQKMIELMHEGLSLDQVAFPLGRTQIAIAWRIIDHQAELSK